MTPGQIAVVAVMFVLTDALVIGVLVIAPIRSEWNGLALKFPAREFLPGAVVKEFQTFQLGLLNMGWSVHAAADSEFLHLRPARILRMLGAKGMSVPWGAINFVRYRRVMRGHYADVSIGGQVLTGPEWCLELARRDDEQQKPRGQ